MTHSDDDGFIVPPRLAPSQIVILPIAPKEETRAEVFTYCENLRKELHRKHWHGRPLEVELDDRDLRGGENVALGKNGIPLRLEIGPRDVAANSVSLGRRDRGPRERANLGRNEFVETVGDILDEIQSGLFQRALKYRDEHTMEIHSKGDFYDFFTPEKQQKAGNPRRLRAGPLERLPGSRENS